MPARTGFGLTVFASDTSADVVTTVLAIAELLAGTVSVKPVGKATLWKFTSGGFTQATITTNTTNTIGATIANYLFPA